MQFKINTVYFDTYAKELVKVTNGTDAEGVFIPTEGIALRVLGMNIDPKTKKASHEVWMTYRRVDPAMLEERAHSTEHFESALSFVSGRI
jgi:hypothetical protein